jgi:DNA polymerase III alpha subunit
MMNLDNYGRQVITENNAVNILYQNPDANIKHLQLDDVAKFNNACKLMHLDLELTASSELNCTPQQYHTNNQNNWHMPIQYAQFDIAEWCLKQCTTEAQLQRVGKELLLYQERDMMSLLCFLRYFVETMRGNNIVWGVGRGSSVASYVLYLIGVHKIDSMYYDLDVEEFLR